MKYEEMSDYYINERVASETGVGGGFSESDCGGLAFANGKVFNPCNNWSDAGGIIKNSKISLLNIGVNYLAVYGFQIEESDHSQEPISDWEIESEHKNPLRAAMIVFLMMQDNKS